MKRAGSDAASLNRGLILASDIALTTRCHSTMRRFAVPDTSRRGAGLAAGSAPGLEEKA
jgi:hypothetical protein